MTDVGAYFGGKSFGKHKLATVGGAAGMTSPNKTIEGAVSQGWVWVLGWGKAVGLRVT